MRAAALLLALAATSCAFPDEAIDGAGYRLPGKTHELSGVTAIVTVSDQQAVNDQAVFGGAMIRGGKANAVTMIPASSGGACFIYLANTADGLAALGHELWHCKNGRWHR